MFANLSPFCKSTTAFFLTNAWRAHTTAPTPVALYPSLYRVFAWSMARSRDPHVFICKTIQLKMYMSISFSYPRTSVAKALFSKNFSNLLSATQYARPVPKRMSEKPRSFNLRRKFASSDKVRAYRNLSVRISAKRKRSAKKAVQMLTGISWVYSASFLANCDRAGGMQDNRERNHRH